MRIGLLGGSFNPAHRGHRHISLQAMRALGLDEVWWLVSPGNPLKAEARDMAPYEARLASAREMAQRAPIRVSDFEQRHGTRYTVDTMRKLKRRRPRYVRKSARTEARYCSSRCGPICLHRS
jgi:nicotinate-nucleotide adenylyltransferase